MRVGGKIAQLDFTMEETWTRVADLFSTNAIECQFTFNPENLERNDAPPRIHFQRSDGSAQFGGTRSGNGEFARIAQAADAYVWGVDVSEDFEKHQALSALGLVVELIGALYCVAPRYPGDEGAFTISYSKATPVLHYGAQFVVSFQFMAPLKWVTTAQHLAVGGMNANLATRS